MQVYRGLDIGSAKPDRAYLEKLPHHLIDVRDPHEQFTAGDFVREADRLIPEILSRDRIPVLSGGTAFYFKNFLYGLPEIPSVDPSIRDELNRLVNKKGLGPLYEELQICDPPTAKRLNRNDSSRIVRAVEVFRGTGKPLSAFEVSHEQRVPYRVRIIGLERDRSELYSRIDRRVDIMFNQGLVGEVRRLISRGLTADLPAMKGIGYSEFFHMMNRGCMTLEDLKDTIKQDSRRYAKRQITFFKSLDGVKWFSPLDRGGIMREVFP
ncbi:tRNA dimethylallyltransferase [Spirochaeta isovalerica]|uniref:tRNA dimethylallyltransferase n=2 Tax=Spirochaeta isovalerica TaxID=150 RepID=A0A841RDW4_9SPIO|nr:tRNA dimethylallyltransferase [Spirochaeta isovalerica]